MTFAAAALAAYAAADITALAGGTLELLDGSNNVLRSFALNAGTAGTSAGAVFTAAGMPKTGTGSGAAAVASARFRNAGAADYKTGIPVGLPGSGAQVIVDVTSGPNAGTLTLGATDVVQLLSATLTHANGS